VIAQQDAVLFPHLIHQDLWIEGEDDVDVGLAVRVPDRCADHGCHLADAVGDQLVARGRKAGGDGAGAMAPARNLAAGGGGGGVGFDEVMQNGSRNLGRRGDNDIFGRETGMRCFTGRLSNGCARQDTRQQHQDAGDSQTAPSVQLIQVRLAQAGLGGEAGGDRSPQCSTGI